MIKKREKQAKSTKLLRIETHLLHNSGATITKLVRSADWLSHSVRGFISGTLRKKLGLEVTNKIEDGKPRRYFLARGVS
jgi:hypothetical protein